MYIYTHLVVASQVETVLQPLDRQAYFLGASVPDLRYLAGMPRDRTHLPLAQIAGWFERYPHLQSFILGYLVHCTLDELKVRKLVFRKLPLAPFRPWMRMKLAHTLLETYYLENTVLKVSLPECGNEVLAELGIGEELVQTFSAWINCFLREPSFEAEIEFLREALLSNSNPRFRRLMGPLLAFQRSRRLKDLLWRSFDPPYFEAGIARYLLSNEGVGKYFQINHPI